MATLTIRKVSALPAVLEANAMYFLVNNNKLIVYVTDAAATIAYNTLTDGDSAAAALAIINSMKGLPNGLATLDGNGDVVEPTVNLEGQNLTISSNSLPIWDTITLNNNDVVDGKLNKRDVANNYEIPSFKHSKNSTILMIATIPHDYLDGSNLVVRINIVPSGIGNNGVVAGNGYFELRTKIAIGMDGGVFEPEVLNTGVAVLPSVAKNSGIPTSIEFTPIVGSSLRPNSVIMVKLSRKAKDANDTFSGDIGFISLDICYNKGQLGTRHLSPNFRI